VRTAAPSVYPPRFCTQLSTVPPQLRTRVKRTKVKTSRKKATGSYTNNFFKMQLFNDLECKEEAWK